MDYSQMPYWAVGAGLLALLFALIFSKNVLSKSPGNARMQEISKAIQEGAMAFLNREYRTFIPIMLIIAVILYFAKGATGYISAISFVLGSTLSGICGIVGMSITTKANCRTTEAARKSLNSALTVAFRSGAVMGLSVAGFGLIGASVLYMIFGDIDAITSFAFGASAVALFARVGGGIYTKAADVGADLVGKVEQGIPEDDPRNPATIADNVGDNVGDTAGMGADLFESYCASIISTMLLGAISYSTAADPLGLPGVMLPVLLGAAGLVATIIGTFFVRTSEGSNPQTALNFGLWGTCGLTAVAGYFLCQWLLPASHVYNETTLTPNGVFYSVIAGLVVIVAIGMITEYYTSSARGPARSIAKSSETGSATNIIQGLAVGMKSTFLPVFVICLGMIFAYNMAGTFGIAMSAMAMLSTSGMIITIDSFGPVADNAGGIAEMSGLDPKVRNTTDKLDATGNTTAAIAKGFAIGSAALTAITLFIAFAEAAQLTTINILVPMVVVGIFIGGAVPFLFSAFCMEAVGKAAHDMISEVRRQFREIPGILEGTGKPDYRACVDISTKAALRQMVAPALLAVAMPILVGFGLGREALGGFIVGGTVSGLMMAIFMSNSGGSWDNAKKYIEEGHHGGKHTPAHDAAVVGDTVGDPFKDTAGPSLNIVIKIMGTISLVIAPLLI
ncbi:MAG: sodium-translocating pyrophosphatase [Desulfosporosinus sp.]|jgi:K(+)-stimulated pyrophosphate-energized sodium pump